MTQNLTKSLIDLRRFGFASQAIAKLCLDHAERRFNVGSLVVLLQEPCLIEVVIVEKSPPKSAFSSPTLSLVVRLLLAPCKLRRAIYLERNVRHGVMVYYGLKIIRGQVSLVCRYFCHREIAPGRFNQSLEDRTITCEAIADFDGGNNVRLDAAHQMHLKGRRRPFSLAKQTLLAIPSQTTSQYLAKNLRIGWTTCRSIRVFWPP